MNQIYNIIIIITLFSLSSYSTARGQVCPGTTGQLQWKAFQSIYDDEFEDLFVLPNYPQAPDVSQTRYNTQSPINYDNYFGARMAGFLHVPSSDTVIFNLTGNHRAKFLLSNTSNPVDTQLIAFVPSWTNITEHDKYPDQTSQPIFLVGGVDYYFEIIYVEGSGNDFAALYWKTNHVDPLNWSIITAAFLKDVACETSCEDAGNPCDDGNAATTDDIWDGNCNCIGKPTPPDACIGERSEIVRYRYNGIAGSQLSSLYAATNYPASPNISYGMDRLGTPRTSDVDSMGQLVQAYITVPITGYYQFVLTADDQTRLHISSDHTPALMTDHEAYVSGWTNMAQFDKYSTQKTDSIYMVVGQYYYTELHHKQGGGGEHFHVFWKTPYQPDQWKQIPDLYLYDYACEIACIAKETPCDDGNPFTNDDKYNGDCECVGTPCSGPDCDSPLANYVPYDKCSVTDQLDNNTSNNWLSCEVSDNPNPQQPRSHWIKYDLGEKHVLLQSHVWNYNVANAVENGFESVSIDYSLNGSSWTNLGNYNWTLASGADNYAGFAGPDFGGIEARYVLITSLDDTLTCRGLGKVAFTAIYCPGEGTICDDKDELTINDQYNDQCECLGTPLLDNLCLDPVLVLGGEALPEDNYSAIMQVTATSKVLADSTISFVAGESIELLPGFEANPSSRFYALIDTCDMQGSGNMAKSSMDRKTHLSLEAVRKAKIEDAGLTITDLPDGISKQIDFYVPEAQTASISLHSTQGVKLYEIARIPYDNRGFYSKRFSTQRLAPGIYFVRLRLGEESYSVKLTK